MKHKAIKNKINSTYNRSGMTSKNKSELRLSLTHLKKNRGEIEKKIEEETGKKTQKLDEELLGQYFTPYKLQLIEQS